MEYGRKRLEPERNILQCAGDVAFTVTMSLVYSKLRCSYTGEEKGSRLETLALHTCEVIPIASDGDGVDIIPLFAEAPSWRELV